MIGMLGEALQLTPQNANVFGSGDSEPNSASANTEHSYFGVVADHDRLIRFSTESEHCVSPVMERRSNFGVCLSAIHVPNFMEFRFALCSFGLSYVGMCGDEETELNRTQFR